MTIDKFAKVVGAILHDMCVFVLWGCTVSRQVYFVHTDLDVHRFLEVIQTHHGRFVVEGKLIHPLDLEESILTGMASDCSRFYLADESLEYAGALDGVSVEFKNCTKGNPLSRTYELGRLYLRRNSLGQYDAAALALYQKLSSFIKRNYNYSKNAHVYASRHFMEGYLRGYFLSHSWEEIFAFEKTTVRDGVSISGGCFNCHIGIASRMMVSVKTNSVSWRA